MSQPKGAAELPPSAPDPKRAAYLKNRLGALKGKVTLYRAKIARAARLRAAYEAGTGKLDTLWYEHSMADSTLRNDRAQLEHYEKALAAALKAQGEAQVAPAVSTHNKEPT